MLTARELHNLVEERNRLRKYCPNCGHTISMPKCMKHTICSYCKHMVFQNKNEEFKYRYMEQMYREKRKNK